MNIKLILIIAFAAILATLLLREVVLWYFKINQRITEQKITNEYLKEHISLQKKLMTLEIEKRKVRVENAKEKFESHGEHFSTDELKHKDTDEKNS